MPMNINNTFDLRLDDLASEQAFRIEPGTPARVTTRLDVGAFNSGQITLFGVIGDDRNGKQLTAIGTGITAASTQVLTAAALTGISEVIARVTTPSGTAGTVAVLTVNQDVPSFVVQAANPGAPLGPG